MVRGGAVVARQSLTLETQVRVLPPEPEGEMSIRRHCSGPVRLTGTYFHGALLAALARKARDGAVFEARHPNRAPVVALAIAAVHGLERAPGLSGGR